MPRIELRDPWGTHYAICTRRAETTLYWWFDEVLPVVNRHLGEQDVPAARINVWPLTWGAEDGADWIADTRVLGRWEEFPACTAEQGIEQLILLRMRLERERKTLPPSVRPFQSSCSPSQGSAAGSART